MGYKYLFPYELVEKNSRITLYGGGEVARQFLDQVINTKHCDCCFIVDRNYTEIQQISGIEVCAPEQLQIREYDKVIIASTLHQNEIYNSLQELSIPNEKIVNTINTYIDDNAVFISDYQYLPKHRKSLENSKIASIIDEWYTNNVDSVNTLIYRLCSYKQCFENIATNWLSGEEPYWGNLWISPFDAMSIYGFIATYNPRYYVEVGSGNTTLFAARSIRDNNLRTRIISIDSHPRTEINKLCYKNFRVPFQDMEMSFFDSLSAEDIFLLDNSHRSFPNSDVTVFFTEVLPRLPSGILYALHDIFLPYDYPEIWADTERRWYNEQYLLCSYLLGGAGGDKIKFPSNYLRSKNEVCKATEALFGTNGLFENIESKSTYNSFFWMEKA